MGHGIITYIKKDTLQKTEEVPCNSAQLSFNTNNVHTSRSITLLDHYRFSDMQTGKPLRLM